MIKKNLSAFIYAPFALTASGAYFILNTASLAVFDQGTDKNTSLPCHYKFCDFL